MKGEILEVLEYPRRYIGTQLKSNDCIHGGFYNLHDPRCLDCESGAECHWLNENDECIAMEMKSIPRLIASLEFSLEYMDCRLAEWGHNIGECQCESCQWMRQAENVYQRSIRC